LKRTKDGDVDKDKCPLCGLSQRLDRIEAAIASLLKQPSPKESDMNELSNIGRLWGGGNHVLASPGNGGMFQQRGAYHMARETAGTYILPDSGAPQYVYAITGPVVVTSVAGVTVATLDAGDMAEFIPNSLTTWSAIRLPSGAAALRDIADEDELQERIDDDVTNGVANQIKSGGITLTGTIDIDGGYGGKLEGYGGAPPANSVQARQSSYLQWNGPRTGSDAMIRYRRGDFTIRELGLYGDLKSTITDGVPTDGNIGILFSKETSIGTGKFHGEGLVFSNWDTAVQISSAAEEANCDESLWTYNTFWRCDKAFRQLSRQSLGHLFVHPHFHEVDCCYELLGGGNITVLGGLYGYSRTNVPGAGNQGAAFVRFKDTDEFGINSGTVSINDLKVDVQARGVRLLDMDEVTEPTWNGGGKCRFTNLQLPFDPLNTTWGGPGFYISGQFHLIIDGATMMYEDAIRWDVDAGTLASCTIINCPQMQAATTNTYADVFDTTNSTGILEVSFNNNFSGTSRLADFNSTITGTG
jgi:hypothetical protein